MQHTPQFAHEFLVCDRIWCRGVECAGQIFTLNCFDEHSVQVREVNPTDVLIAAPDRAAAKPLGEPGQNRQRASVATEHETDPQQHTARFRHDSGVESVFPLPANLGEFVFATGRALIAPLIPSVSVKSNCARLHPHARWMRDVTKGRRNNANRIHARLRDFQNVFRTVRAIDIASGEIHHRIHSIETFYPFADVRAAPFCFPDAVAAFARRARQHDDFVVSREQFLGEQFAKKAAAARKHDTFLVNGPFHPADAFTFQAQRARRRSRTEKSRVRSLYPLSLESVAARVSYLENTPPLPGEK